MLRAWNKITKKRLIRKVYQLNAHDTKALISSISLTAVENQINLQYNYYGMFADMGVGKGVPLSAARSNTSSRKAKPWYSKTIFREVAKLSEILSRDFAIKAQAAITSEIKTTTKISLYA